MKDIRAISFLALVAASSCAKSESLGNGDMDESPWLTVEAPRIDVRGGDIEIAMKGDSLTLTEDLCWRVEKNVDIALKSPFSLKAKADFARLDPKRGVLELKGGVDSRVKMSGDEDSK